MIEIVTVQHMMGGRSDGAGLVVMASDSHRPYSLKGTRIEMERDTQINTHGYWLNAVSIGFLFLI